MIQYEVYYKLYLKSHLNGLARYPFDEGHRHAPHISITILGGISLCHRRRSLCCYHRVSSISSPAFSLLAPSSLSPGGEFVVADK